MRIAIIEKNKVANVVEGELEAVAKLFPIAIGETEETGNAWIGARWNGQKFEPVKIYDSWTWNEATFEYEPPIPKPEGNYQWVEDKQEWVVPKAQG